MALLTTPERLAVWAEMQRQISKMREPISITRPQGLEFIDAVDQWMEDNAASFNSAIPQPQRSNLTATQKMHGFNMVTEARLKVLRNG